MKTYKLYQIGFLYVLYRGKADELTLNVVMTHPEILCPPIKLSVCSTHLYLVSSSIHTYI